jgi:hypothetical protein
MAADVDSVSRREIGAGHRGVGQLSVATYPIAGEEDSRAIRDFGAWSSGSASL